LKIQLAEIVAFLISQFKKKNSKHSANIHIEAGIKWLSRAQDATPDGGVSIRFSLLRGWESSYPETTGYIIPTFLQYSKITGDESYRERALRMAEWELSIQQDDGSFIGGPLHSGVGKLVFDTGQIIFGLLEAYQCTNDERFIKAAKSAGDWLLNVQDEDGSWRTFTYHAIPHTYHSRVAWPLAKLYKVTEETKYLDGAKKNIEWVLSNQAGNGWFRNAGFTVENSKDPYTHTIAYTIRGVLEAGMLLEEQRYIDAARRSANEILRIIDPEGFFWGKYDSSWKSNNKFSCLTGNAQTSIILLKLYKVTNDLKYFEGACILNKYLRARQDVTTKNENIRGAIAGSWPIWGEYERLSYPNWATKFFVDAMILEKQYKDS